ncbi:Uncharacterized protein PHSC3_001117 [Chlamydiales bacterium STE3]|nr:Uncharacterized protein PHSC3_001117 [Chlamydiales bacterium STE3]
MTTGQFDGVGYYTGGINTVAPYLTTASEPQQFLYTMLLQRKQAVVGGSDINDFLAQYNQANPLPQTIDEFTEAFAQYYNLSATFGSLAAAKAQLKQDILNSVKAAIQTNPNSFGPYGPQDADYDPLIDPVGTQIDPAQPTINDDIAERSFTSFLRNYTYTFSGNTTSTEFQNNWGNFYLTIATVKDDYRYIFEAFFANNTDTNGFTDFQNTLSGFVKNIMYGSDTTAAFLPGQNYSDWFVKVQQEYAKSLYGSSSNVQSSIGPSVEGAKILDTILRLIIKMIGTLQVVTAAQSERLTFLTQWQRAYTNLEGQVRSFIKNGPEWIQWDDDSRNQLNQLNQTYTEQIRSRRTVVSDDAKALQTNINQSNDVANQQTSLATAIIQQMSTILSAIYR